VVVDLSESQWSKSDGRLDGNPSFLEGVAETSFDLEEELLVMVVIPPEAELSPLLHPVDVLVTGAEGVIIEVDTADLCRYLVEDDPLAIDLENAAEFLKVGQG